VAQHASTRIQQRETLGTFRMVLPRQRKEVRNNNPQSANNQRSTAHTKCCASETTTQHQIQNYSGSTVGTVAPTRASVPPAVAYTCNASSHERGGGDVRPGRGRGGSSSGKCLQKLHRRPAQAPVGLHGEGSEGATCPPPPHLQNLEASLKDTAAPAVCAARRKKMMTKMGSLVDMIPPHSKCVCCTTSTSASCHRTCRGGGLSTSGHVQCLRYCRSTGYLEARSCG
jgi:hypothetical protein